MLLQSGTAFQLEKLLQSGTEVVTKWDSFFVTKWDGSCYKVGQVLQSVTIVTKWALTIAKKTDHPLEYYDFDQNIFDYIYWGFEIQQYVKSAIYGDVKHLRV